MPLSDHNDETRMTRHQLAARIQQMEATAHRNSTIGAPKDRHRHGEDLRRREKIARYREELQRRERADALEAAREQAAREEAARDLHAWTNATCARLEQAEAAEADAPAIACIRCGVESTLTDPDAGQPAHIAIGTTWCNARPDEYRLITDPAKKEEPAPMTKTDWTAAAELDDEEKARTEREGRNDHAHQRDAAERAQEQTWQSVPDPPTPVVVLQPRMTTTPPPPLRVGCPQCHAEPGMPCTNYTGARMGSFHSGRTEAARPDPTPEKCSHIHTDGQRCSKNARNAHYATGAPLCQQHAREARRLAAAIAGTSPARQDEHHPDPAAPAAEEDPLTTALLELIRQHTLPAVLDAAWAAGRKLHPRPAGYGAGC